MICILDRRATAELFLREGENMNAIFGVYMGFGPEDPGDDGTGPDHDDYSEGSKP